MLNRFCLSDFFSSDYVYIILEWLTIYTYNLVRGKSSIILPVCTSFRNVCKQKEIFQIFHNPQAIMIVQELTRKSNFRLVNSTLL